MSTISLCMIVKNEARWIEQSLASVMDWVDEMIVIDTGSSDNTAEIARSMGAQVFYYQWDDDFSRARNYSLSKATSDWILVLDADEVISKNETKKICEIIKEEKSELISLVQTTYCAESATLGWIPNHLTDPEAVGYPGYIESPLVRLFRNNGSVSFTGCVHEHANHQNPKVKPSSSDVRIHHYGKYLPQAVAKNKEALYLKLGLEKCQKNPMDPHSWYELGVQYWGMKQEDKAEEAFLKSESLDSNYVRTLVALGGIFTIKKAYPKALRYYSKVMDLDQQNIIPYLYLPTLLIEMKNFRLALDILKYGQRFASGHPPFHINKGIVYQHMGNHRVAIECFDDAIKINAHESLAIYNKAISFGALKQYQDAISYLSKVLNDEKVGLLAHKKMIEMYYCMEENKSALDMLDSAYSKYGRLNSLLFQEAVIHLRTGNVELAKQLIGEMTEFSDFDHNGLLNLRQCCQLCGRKDRLEEIDQLLISRGSLETSKTF